MVDGEPARVLPVEASALAEDPLLARIVALLVVAEVDGALVVVPVVSEAGQRASLLAHVTLCVAAARAEREELHHLAPVVLVRRALLVVGAGEPEQHRGVAGDREQQPVERAEAVAAKESVLTDHQPL